MSLSDFVGSLNLAACAEIAMFLIMAIFAGVVVYLIFSRKERMDRMARMPLEEARHE